MYPKKIYAELSTRCNLLCSKCVKQAAGSDIEERDMPLTVFQKLLPALSHADHLILNGIGEPMLHPHLAKIIYLARGSMGKKGQIAFQSNGTLLTSSRCRELMDAGLNTICLSVDNMPKQSIPFLQQTGHSFAAVAEAVAHLNQARQKFASDFKIGLEIVLQKESVVDLPLLVRWAVDNKVDYIITTHLIPYNKEADESAIFNPNSAEAIALFQKYDGLARGKGIDLAASFTHYRKFAGSRSSSEELHLFAKMQEEANKKDIRLNIEGLLKYHKRRLEDYEKIFSEARSIADGGDIDLFLPPLQARTRRSCAFLEDKAVFIAANGDVMPCHFVWHTYSSHLLQDEIQIDKRVFGNIAIRSLVEIWQSPEYRRFRAEASHYETTTCWSCPMAPCPSLVNENVTAGNDCYGSQVPCGHCQWNLGGIRCL